jgi:hypothetical protein
MMRTESDLEVALSEVEVQLDTDRVLAAVHRRGAARRRRRTIGTVAVTAAVLATVGTPFLLTRDRTTAAPGQGEAPATTAPATTASAYACVATPLALPAGVTGLDQNITNNIMVGPSGMDPTGRYVVGVYSGPDAPIVVRWSNGQPATVAVNAARVVGAAVNSRGVIVGGALHELQGVRTVAWTSADGAYSELPMPAGFVAAQALAINGQGEAVGFAQRVDGTRVAVAWSPSHQLRVLSAPGNASAQAIGDDGTVVGFADGVQTDLAMYGDVTAGRGRPYAWDPAGTGRFLEMPPGQDVGVATGVRGEWAVGSASHLTTLTANGHTKDVLTGVAVRWNLRTGEMSTVDNWSDNMFLAVNVRGDVASLGPAGPTVVHNGQSYVLPGLADEAQGQDLLAPMLLGPTVISDDATVIVGRHIGLPERPVIVWNC